MAHLHPISDDDRLFVIDPTNRSITYEGDNIVLVKGDLNSEVFSFEIPRIVEGHDMSLCDHVRIHYSNTDRRRKNESKDIYYVTDCVVNGDVVNFSWTLSGNATKYYGTLSFLVQFCCLDEDGTYSYIWNTDTYKSIPVYDSYNNSEGVEENYADVFDKIFLQLEKVPDDMEQLRQELLDVVTNVKHPITYIESAINDKPKVNFRDLESGSYIIYGYFEPYPNSSVSIASDKSLIHVYRADAGSYVICLDPLNAKIVFFEIMVDDTNEKRFTYKRESISLLDLESTKNKVTTIDDTSTDEQYPSAKAVNDTMIAMIGDLAMLETTDKSNLVTAINEAARQAATDNDIIDALVENDLLCALIDENGNILTDEFDNILV